MFTEDIFIVSISLSYESVMAIDMYGKLYSWGKGEYGCLGHNDQWNLSKPVLVNQFKDQIVLKAKIGIGFSIVEILKWNGYLSWKCSWEE